MDLTVRRTLFTLTPVLQISWSQKLKDIIDFHIKKNLTDIKYKKKYGNLQIYNS